MNQVAVKALAGCIGTASFLRNAVVKIGIRAAPKEQYLFAALSTGSIGGFAWRFSAELALQPRQTRLIRSVPRPIAPSHCIPLWLDYEYLFYNIFCKLLKR